MSLKLLRFTLPIVAVLLLAISLNIACATPSENFTPVDGEVVDDWGIYRTNAYGERGYFMVLPEDNPQTMYPIIIINESLGPYMDLAWQKGLEFKEQYDSVEERAERILEYVQSYVEYKYDDENPQLPVSGYSEFARNADETMRSILEEGIAYGDCEDHAILLATMYMAAGVRCAIVAMADPYMGGHATVLVYLPGYNPGYPVHFFTLDGEWGWVMAEATGDIPLGYMPEDYLMYVENCMNYGFFVYYILEPNQTTLTPGAKYITVGETYSGTVGEGGNESFYVFLREGRSYRVVVTPVEGDPDLYVYDPQGSLVNSSSTMGVEEVEFQADSTGYYLVVVLGAPSVEFQLQVVEVRGGGTAEGGRITVGESYQGSVEMGQSVYYVVYLEEGGIYRLTLTPTSGDPDVVIYNVWGVPIATSMEYGLTPEVAEFTADTSGDYVIEVYGYETSTYTLRVDEVEVSYEMISVGETKSGYVGSDSSMYYVAELDVGTYLITLTPVSGDPDLYVYDEWGFLESSSTNGEGEVDEVILEVYVPSVYIIEVYGYTSSNYELTLQEYGAVASEEYITVGEEVQGYVDRGTSNLYYVELEYGKTYLITLTPISGDPDLYVYDPWGFIVDWSENPGYEVDYALITAWMDGYYTIEVFGFETSSYTLTVEEYSLWSSVSGSRWFMCMA